MCLPSSLERQANDRHTTCCVTLNTTTCISVVMLGPECQVLDLAQVPKEGGYHLSATSSWGGSILQDDTGKLWMYAAEMVGHCGIGSWTRNSRVILASSESISSPFKFEKELFGVFSHEPFATRGPKGEYVLYFTTTTLGCGAYGECVPADTCAGMGNGTTCNPGGPTCWNNCSKGATSQGCFDHSSERSPRTRFPTYMTYASHPLGPYSKPVMVYNGSDQAGLNAPATGDTNMAGVIFSDGSLIGMWRGDRKQLNHSGPVYQYQYAVNASDWKDPSTYQWGYALEPYNIFPGLIDGPADTRNCGIEDPHMWLDKNEIVSVVLMREVQMPHGLQPAGCAQNCFLRIHVSFHLHSTPSKYFYSPSDLLV